MTLVDTNVVIDVLAEDADWYSWSSQKLEEIAKKGPVLMNEITYAELAYRVADEAGLRSALTSLGLTLGRTPDHGLFLAGRAFAAYRASGGPRTTLLADFLIGAHAEAEGLPILTRDPRRFRSYFPKVTLITP